MPIENARRKALPPLHQGIDGTAAPRVDGTDGSHFSHGGIARMHERHEIGQGNVAGGRSLWMARPDAVAHLAQNRDQLSAFHGLPFGGASTSRSLLYPDRRAV
jgi:hypothetical protein